MKTSGGCGGGGSVAIEHTLRNAIKITAASGAQLAATVAIGLDDFDFLEAVNSSACD